jgi:hypothetical protein
MKTCWIYRKVISWAADAQSPVPDWAQRHLRACQACEHFHQTEMRLSAALAAVKATGPEFPPFLHARIMAAIKGAERKPDFQAVVLRRMAVTLGAVAVITAVAAVTMLSLNRDKLPQTQAAAPTISNSVLLDAPDASQLFAWSKKLDQPLETELKAVVNDAKTALASLSDTFLPSHNTNPQEF